MGYAFKSRQAPGTQEPMRLDNPAWFTARSLQANVAAERQGKGPISPLTSDEAEALKAHINTAPADGKVALFRKLRQGFATNQSKPLPHRWPAKRNPSPL